MIVIMARRRRGLAITAAIATSNPEDANRQLMVGASVVPKATEFERVRCLVEAGWMEVVVSVNLGSLRET